MWRQARLDTLRPTMDAGVHPRFAPLQRAAQPLARALVVLLASCFVWTPASPQGSADAALPARLSDTGLYAAGSTTQLQPGVLSFTPQYPLWSDGADKRRWIRLPAGGAIDASAPDAWQFPPGTQLWKEFGHGSRRVETRYIERLRDGRWRYATYVWNEQGNDATLAPARGITALPVAEAPQGRYDIPARADCTSCHEGAATPVLGFSALQLSPDRDPLAAHAMAPQPDDVDLRAARRARARAQPAGLPAAAAAARAGRFSQRACGTGLPARQLRPLPQPQRQRCAGAFDAWRSRRSTVPPAVPTRWPPRSAVAGRYRSADPTANSALIEPQSPERSVLVARMQSRQAASADAAAGHPHRRPRGPGPRAAVDPPPVTC